MRKLIYSALTGDSTLAGIVVGGWHTFGKVTTGSNFPSTPFGVIRMAGEMTDIDTPDKSITSQLCELYVYDRKRKRDDQIIASYLSIDTALNRIYAVMNRKYFDMSSYRYLDTAYDTTSPDLVDDAWGCLFKYSRWVCRVAR